MARIRVVTDSASDLPQEIAQRLEIDVVPLTIRFGNEEFTDLSPEDFWAKCKVAKTLPETSAPSPGAFQTAYERAKAVPKPETCPISSPARMGACMPASSPTPLPSATASARSSTATASR